MIRDNLELNSGLVKFHSREGVSTYLETLLEYYKSRQEEYGHQLGEYLRSEQSPQRPEREAKKDSKKDKDGQPQLSKGWARVGNLIVNSSDPKGGLAQVTLRIVDDYKARVEKVSDALKSFKDVDTLSQSGTTTYTLFVFKGVPEAVIVERAEKRVEAFAFSSTFRAV